MTEAPGLSLGIAVVLGALLGPAALLVVLFAVLALQSLRRQWSVTYLILVAACCLVGAARMAMTDAPVAPPDLANSTGAMLVVDSLPRPSPSGVSVEAIVTRLSYDSELRDVEPFPMMVWLPGGDLVAPGDVLSVGWSASLVDTIEPGFGGYVTAQGAAATGYVWWMTVEERGSSWFRLLVSLRDRISDGLARVLPGDAGALAAGIVTGDDSRLSESAKDAFLYTGTSHITAVSGSNVAMVLAIWNLVIPAGRNRRLLAVQLVVIVSIWIYTLLVGLEPPALRAAIMASLVLLGSRFGRRPDLMTLLALTSAALVLWNPNHVHMVGFWLSVVATAALIMRVPETPDVGWKASIRGMLEGILLAQVATLPIILVTFGTLSLTSPVANALLTPIMWLAFPFCFTLAAVVLLVPFVAPAVAVIPLIPLSLALQVVDHLSAAAPRLNVQNAGFAGLVTVVVPCLVIAAMLSRDARRWGAIVATRWREQPGLVASALIGPSIGVMIALLVAVSIE